MKKRVLSIIFVLTVVLSCIVFVSGDDTPETSIKLTGNTGAVITSAEDITDVFTEDGDTLCTVSYEGKTATVKSNEGAAGISKVTVKTAGNNTYEYEIPLGYTTFAFDGNTLKVYEGTSSKYEILLVTVAGEETSPSAESGEDGSKIYKNTSDGKLDIEIKKAGGDFVFTGKGDDMSVAVKKEATGNSTLNLCGLNLASSYTAPITVKKDSQASVFINVCRGFENTLSDCAFNDADTYGDTKDGGNGENANYAESAVIKGKDYSDINFTGSGKLTLNCFTKNAVKVGRYGFLTVDGPELIVNSTNHGLSCENVLKIKSGRIIINADHDGIRTDPDEIKPDKGLKGDILLAGGRTRIFAGKDAIQAAGSLSVEEGAYVFGECKDLPESTISEGSQNCAVIATEIAAGQTVKILQNGKVLFNTVSPTDAEHIFYTDPEMTSDPVTYSADDSELVETVWDECQHEWLTDRTVDATCTEKGTVYFVCRKCGVTKTEEIDIIPCKCLEYKDLKASQWYHEGIDYVLNKEMMNGVGEGKFDPNGSLTRGMLVTILYRKEGSPSVEGQTTPFTDIKKGKWYADGVTWAYNRNVVNGISATAFEPDTPISREQIATILFRYLGAEQTEENLGKFPDAKKVSSYASLPMSWAAENGIIQGISGKLEPKQNATRAQIATILQRIDSVN